MEQGETQKQRKQFALLAALGVGFWFLVGFPFGNHNESYAWVAYFEHHSLWNVIWTHHLPIATLRPLGQGLAYLGWKVSGGSTWTVQMFNFVLAALALYGMALATQEAATFALAMAVTGGTFFAGFIYLFHLHGIFYSPVLVILALLLHLERAGGSKAIPGELGVFFCAVFVGLLFHPYALILFLAFIAGRIVERWTESTFGKQRLRILLGILIFFLILASRPSWHEMQPSANLQGILTSYRMTEPAPILSVLATVLSVATILSIEKIGLKYRLVLGLGVLLSAGGLALAGLPVVMLWVAVAIFKLAYLRRWTLCSMALGASVLPGIAPSGSPTYAIFAVLLSTFALAEGFTVAEGVLQRVDTRWVYAVIILAVGIDGGLRAGVRIPGVSKLAQPLIAEREKTWQLESVINWMLASPYRDWNLRLDGNTENPIGDETTAINRRNRPPAYQHYIDLYLAAQRGSVFEPGSLIVTFGGRELEGMKSVYSVAGRFAGPSFVFK